MADLSRLVLTMRERRSELSSKLEAEIRVLKSERKNGERWLSVERLGYVIPLPTPHEMETSVAADLFAQRDLPKVFRELGDNLAEVSDPLGLIAIPNVSEFGVGADGNLIKWVTQHQPVRASGYG